MPTSKPLRILAVEDNPETQLLLRHLLRDMYEITIADGVDEALAQADEQPFQLLLLDINLSEQKTGLDLLDLLRKKENTKDAASIALTAYAMPGDRENFLDAGFDAYISKPFTRDDLLAIIDSTLPSYRSS